MMNFCINTKIFNNLKGQSNFYKSEISSIQEKKVHFKVIWKEKKGSGQLR